MLHVMQLEKSTQIQSVDIGNDGSAFVEVLVGRSTAPDSYEVLLGMSTFMTPQESKQWNNANRVRIFGEYERWLMERKICIQVLLLMKHYCAKPSARFTHTGLQAKPAALLAVLCMLSRVYILLMLCMCRVTTRMQITRNYVICSRTTCMPDQQI